MFILCQMSTHAYSFTCLLEKGRIKESHLDPLVVQNECLAAEGILILTVSLRWICFHGGAQRTGQCK